VAIRPAHNLVTSAPLERGAQKERALPQGFFKVIFPFMGPHMAKDLPKQSERFPRFVEQHEILVSWMASLRWGCSSLV
jgi:hypothetical protein